MHARDDATAIQNNATRGQESKTKKNLDHPVKITGSRGGYQLHQVLRIERENMETDNEGGEIARGD